MILNIKCDLCSNQAVVDTKTIYGPWAHLCKRHWDSLGSHTKGLYSVIVEDINKVKICPKCGRQYDDYPALSRIDNSEICPECGMIEALGSMINYYEKENNQSARV